MEKLYNTTPFFFFLMKYTIQLLYEVLVAKLILLSKKNDKINIIYYDHINKFIINIIYL